MDTSSTSLKMSPSSATTQSYRLSLFCSTRAFSHPDELLLEDANNSTPYFSPSQPLKTELDGCVPVSAQLLIRLTALSRINDNILLMCCSYAFTVFLQLLSS